ncbi:MAG TPA: SDR family oxidoreductase [Nevskiaceae bacterium]|nr:SDR family oxidoreductase [Nevskiaceae bacterium]
MERPGIFITGAAAGIGRATAKLFASRGWFVGAYDMNAAGLAALAAELGSGNCITGKLDVTDASALADALEAFFQAAGRRLDVLFNCAGILSVGNFEDIPLARHHLIVDINLKGVLNGFHCALPYLKQTRGARVVSMASASAVFGSPAYASYSATKFAVRGLTEAMNIEWARHGITVMAVWPIFVNTAMVTEIEQPESLKKMGVHLQASDVANVIWRAAHRPRWLPRVHWFVGAQTWFLWMATRLMPVWMMRLTTRRVTGY